MTKFYSDEDELVCPDHVYYVNRSRGWKRQRLSAAIGEAARASMAEKSDKAKGEKRFDIEEDLSKVEVPDISAGAAAARRRDLPLPDRAAADLARRRSRWSRTCWPATACSRSSAQKNPEEENPAPEGLFARGTAGRILKMLKYPDGSVRILVQGLRASRSLEFVAARAVLPRARAAPAPRPVERDRTSRRCRRTW